MMRWGFPEQIDWRDPLLGEWFLPLPAFELQSESTTLLLIDLQNYAIRRDMGYGPALLKQAPHLAEYYFDRIERVVIPANVRLLRAFREAGRRVIYTRVGPLLADGADLIPRRRRRDRDQLAEHDAPALWPVGTSEHAIIDELAPRPGELVFDKNSSGAFNSTGIDQILHNLGIESLIITGIATEMCVETTARDASDRGFNVVIVEDATATFEPISHISSLYNWSKTYGLVRCADEIIQWLGKA